MKKLIFSLLMLISCSAWSEWVLVDATDWGETYVDPRTIRREGTIRKFWLLGDAKVRTKTGYMSFRARVEIDCKKERQRITALQSFRDSMLKGLLGESANYPNDEWNDIPPGTTDEATMEYVCAK